MFWTPAFAGVTTEETFYEVINYLLESLRVHSPRLAAVVVIPAEAGIQENGLDFVSSTE